MQRDQKTGNPAAKRSYDDISEAIKIKGRLLLKGFSLLDIDRDYDLPCGTAGTTLREPNLAGEKAISAALGTRPHLLWRRRYTPPVCEKHLNLPRIMNVRRRCSNAKKTGSYRLGADLAAVNSADIHPVLVLQNLMTNLQNGATRYTCLRYGLLPMCPGRTIDFLVAEAV